MERAFSRETASGIALALASSISTGAAAFDGSLFDAVALTVEHQAAVLSSLQAMVAADGQVLTQRAAFETNVSAGVGGARTLIVSPGGLPGVPPNVIDTRTETYSAGVTRRLRSGTIVNPAVTVTRTRDLAGNLDGLSIANVALNFTVPLLKGDGMLVNTAGEVAAEYGVRAANESYRDTLANAIAGTVVAYWDYLGAGRVLHIARATEGRAQTLLDEAGRLAKADEIPRTDLLKYEAKLARDRATRLGAERALADARAALALAIGAPAQNGLPDARDDFPAAQDSALALLRDGATLDALARHAYTRRFDLLAAEQRLAAAETLLRAARADDKPRFDLTASVGYTGFTAGHGGGPGALSSFYNAPRGPNLTFGLAYVLPASNYENTGLILQRTAAAEQARLAREAILRSIDANLKARLEALRASSLQLEETLREVRLQAQVFENERRRYRLGLATLLDLLTTESQLTAAQISEIEARRELSKAVIRYRAETATLLDPGQAQRLDRARLTTLPGPADLLRRR